MPKNYRKSFYEGEIKVCYRQKPNGVYEARYHRGGINVEVSSKDFTTLRKKFAEAFKAKIDLNDSKSAATVQGETMNGRTERPAARARSQNGVICKRNNTTPSFGYVGKAA